MSIGSHSLSHRSLGRMDAQEADGEIRRSRQILEHKLGRRVDLFAYPFGSPAYGDFNEHIQGIVRKAGYLGACTTMVGTNRPGANPFALRRIPVDESDGPFRLRAKLVGAYDWVGWIKVRWQRLAAREDLVDVSPIAEADHEGSAT